MNTAPRLFAAALLGLSIAGPAAFATDEMLPGNAEAIVDLATREGVVLLKSEWRYSDTKIIEVDFKSAGADNQPTGAPVKTYDYTPHAGGADV